MKERILVVDDDREIVKAIALLLEKEEYEVLKEPSVYDVRRGK